MRQDEAKAAVYEQFTRIGKALANPRRLELLDLLAQGERSVETLARSTAMNLTTASAHLQALRHANLVVTRRAGTRVFYRLAGPDVAALHRQLQRVAEAHLPDLVAARTALLGADGVVEEIGRAELVRRVDEGSVVVIDVRPVEEYAVGHIAGAVSVPLDELPDRLDELPDGAEVVAYCRGPYCVLSVDAVRLVRATGRPARRLEDSVLDWAEASLPIERSAVA